MSRSALGAKVRTLGARPRLLTQEIEEIFLMQASLTTLWEDRTGDQSLPEGSDLERETR